MAAQYGPKNGRVQNGSDIYTAHKQKIVIYFWGAEASNGFPFANKSGLAQSGQRLTHKGRHLSDKKKCEQAKPETYQIKIISGAVATGIERLTNRHQ